MIAPLTLIDKTLLTAQLTALADTAQSSTLCEAVTESIVVITMHLAKNVRAAVDEQAQATVVLAARLDKAQQQISALSSRLAAAERKIAP